MELAMILIDEGTDFTVCQMHVDGARECVTIQDGHRDVKVHGKTRIPEGTFEVKFRTVGGFHDRYLKEYGPAFHKGMLWLQNVPGFTYILIHVGNTPKDTDGCVCVGANRHPTDRAMILGSKIAYRKFYPKVAAALLRGERVHITIRYTRA